MYVCGFGGALYAVNRVSVEALQYTACKREIQIASKRAMPIQGCTIYA
jgi:hypothetical protein